MKLVWHLVRNDFRRMWLPLVLWAAVLAIKNEIGVFLFASAGPDALRFQALGYWALGFTGFGFLVNFILVGTLVHEDALVGTRMFWVTRPISGGRLLAAKTMSAALMFGLIPVLASLRWWIACGYGWNEIGRATLATLDGQIVVIVSALTYAALTENMNRFLGWSLAAALLSAVLVWSPQTLDPSYVMGPETTGLITTKIGLMFLLGGVTITFVIVSQFLRRPRRRALVALAVAAVMTIMIKRLWIWDWTSGARREAQTSSVAKGMAFEVEQALIYLSRDGSGSVALDYRITGLPEEMGVRSRADHFFKLAGGAEVVARSNFKNGGWPGGAELKALALKSTAGASAQSYLAAGPPVPLTADRLRLVSWLRAKTLSPLRGARGDYVGDLEVETVRPENWIELPLRAGERGKREGVGVQIGSVEWQDGAVKVTLTESRPLFETYRRTLPSLTSLNVLSRGEEAIALGYALVNRDRGEAIKLWPRGERAGVGVQALRHLSFTADLPPDQLSAWFEGATLVTFRYSMVERWRADVKAAGLVVAEQKDSL